MPAKRYLYRVLPEEALAGWGLRRDDEISRVNGRPIEDASSRDALQEQLATGEMVLFVRGGDDSEREIRVQIPE